MKRILLFLALFCGSLTANASIANVYIAQTAAGGNTGVDCADAFAATFFNTSGNWGSGSSQIGAGTTVHLCGTFTGTAGQSGLLSVQGSGSSGNPVRIQFETGANATAPYWGANGFIVVSGKSHILIDGSPTSTPCGYVNSIDVSCNGEIQSSANGASLANHIANVHGITLSNGSDDIEVRNVNCQNLFVPVQNSANNETTSGVNNSACVWWLGNSGGTTNINIHNLQINNSFNGILEAYEGSNTSVVANNSWMQNIEVGVQLGGGSSGATITTASISGNDMSDMANWDAPADANHHEFFHVYTQQTSAVISTLIINGNYFHGTLGATMTAEFYIECDGTPCTAPTSITAYITNNVVVNEDPNADISTGSGGNGMTECEGSTCFFYNNTFYSIAQFASPNGAIHYEAGSLVTAQNNVFQGMHYALATSGGTLTASNNQANGLSTACGSPCNQSGNSNLNLSSAPPYQLSNTSSSAYQTGVNLTSKGLTQLDVDQLGVARPASGAWDMGAFEFVSSTVATPTASPAAGNYTSAQTVTLSTTTGGATICYRTDGTNPSAATPGTCDAGSTTYSGAITVNITQTILALGTLSGDTNSGILTATYNITPPPFVGLLTSQTDLTTSGTWTGDHWYTTNGAGVPGNYFGPAFGGTKLDAVFGTTSFRMPNTTDFPAAGGCVSPNTQGLSVDYSKIIPQSRDGQYILIPDTCGNDYLFKNTGTLTGTTFLRRIQIDSVTNAFATNGSDFLGDTSDWTFSQNPASDLIYYIGRDTNTSGQNTLKSYSPATNTSTVIFDFSTVIAGYPGATSVDDFREGNPSEDDRYWFLGIRDASGTQYGAIIYDRTANAVIANKTVAAGGLCGASACASSGPPINWTGVCGDGTTNYFLANMNNAASRPWLLARGLGTEVYDISLNFLGWADYANGHADCGRDVNGNWVYATVPFETTHFDAASIAVVNLANVSTTPPVTNNPNWAGMVQIGVPCQWNFTDATCLTSISGAPQSYTISMRGSHGTQQGTMILSNFFAGTSLTGLGGWGAVENDAITLNWTTGSTLGGTGVQILPIAPLYRINRTHAINAEYFTQGDGVPNWDSTRIFYNSSGDVNNGPSPAQMSASELATANPFYHMALAIQLPLSATPPTTTHQIFGNAKSFGNVVIH